MILTLPALLSMFSLLAISAGVYFLSLRAKLPYTVMLVAVGAFVLVPLSMLPPFAFLREFTLTPEVLLYIFLPILIFESAYNIDIRRLFENLRAISALAVFSLLISAIAVSVGLYVLFPFIGLDIPFAVCLLFGALISATDPVAVLALFKEVGAPRRLTLLFEGESIFNDGTAVALFLVVLGVMANGWEGISSVAWGGVDFLVMIIGGILLGLLIGGLFVKAIDGARSNEFVQIALMIVLAHLTFLISDYISEHFVFLGREFHISAIISTAIASIVVGNYGRAKVLPHAQEFVEKFWTATAFLANSLVFLLIGFIFVALPINIVPFIPAMLLAVLVVAVARMISIYPVVWGVNALGREQHIPRTWQHLLAWGSLRGALAIAMVLLIPDTTTVPGWSLEATPKEFILALTLGCIFATLFIKATTIQSVVSRLGIDTLSDLERLEYQEASALIHLRALERISRFSKKGYIDARTAEVLESDHRALLRQACLACKRQMGKHPEGVIGERVLRLYMIGIERETLDTLYDYGEVNEKVYRRVLSKLTLQYERVESGQGSVDASEEGTDVLDRLATGLKKVLTPKRLVYTDEDMYMYYRTQTILSRSAIASLRHLDAHYATVLFGERAPDRIREVYEGFLAGSTRKLQDIIDKIPQKAEVLSERFARRAILEAESGILEELSHRTMVTPKVAIALQEMIEKQSHKECEKFGNN